MNPKDDKLKEISFALFQPLRFPVDRLYLYGRSGALAEGLLKAKAGDTFILATISVFFSTLVSQPFFG